MQRFSLPLLIANSPSSSSAAKRLQQSQLTIARNERIKSMAITELASLVSSPSSSPSSTNNNNNRLSYHHHYQKPLLETCRRNLSTLERCGALPKQFHVSLNSNHGNNNNNNNAPFIPLDSHEALLLLDVCAHHPKELGSTYAEMIFEAYRFAVLERPRGTYTAADIRQVTVKAMKVCPQSTALKIFLRDVVAFSAHNNNNNDHHAEVVTLSSNDAARQVLDFLDELTISSSCVDDARQTEEANHVSKTENDKAEKYLSVLFEEYPFENDHDEDSASNHHELLLESIKLSTLPASQFLSMIAANTELKSLLSDFVRIFTGYFVLKALPALISSMSKQQFENDEDLYLLKQRAVASLLSPALSICLNESSTSSSSSSMRHSSGTTSSLDNATRIIHTVGNFFSNNNNNFDKERQNNHDLLSSKVIDHCLEVALIMTTTENTNNTDINNNTMKASQIQRQLEKHAKISDFIMTAFSSKETASKFCRKVLRDAAAICFQLPATTTQHISTSTTSSVKRRRNGGKSKELIDFEDDDDFLFFNSSTHHHHHHHIDACPEIQVNKIASSAFAITRALIKAHHHSSHKHQQAQHRILKNPRKNDFLDKNKLLQEEMKLFETGNGLVFAETQFGAVSGNNNNKTVSSNTCNRGGTNNTLDLWTASSMCTITAASSQLSASIELCCNTVFNAFSEEIILSHQSATNNNNNNNTRRDDHSILIPIIKEMTKCITIAAVCAVVLNDPDEAARVVETYHKMKSVIKNSSEKVIMGKNKEVKLIIDVIVSRADAGLWLIEKAGLVEISPSSSLSSPDCPEEEFCAISSVLGLYSTLLLERSNIQIPPSNTILENLARSFINSSNSTSSHHQNHLLHSQVEHLLCAVMKKYGDADTALTQTISDELVKNSSSPSSGSTTTTVVNKVNAIELGSALTNLDREYNNSSSNEQQTINDSRRQNLLLFVPWPTISHSSELLTLQQLAECCVTSMMMLMKHDEGSINVTLAIDVRTSAFLLPSLLTMMREQKLTAAAADVLIICNNSVKYDTASSEEDENIAALNLFNQIISSKSMMNKKFSDMRLIGKLSLEPDMKNENSSFNNINDEEELNSSLLSSSGTKWWSRHVSSPTIASKIIEDSNQIADNTNVLFSSSSMMSSNSTSDAGLVGAQQIQQKQALDKLASLFNTDNNKSKQSSPVGGIKNMKSRTPSTTTTRHHQPNIPAVNRSSSHHQKKQHHVPIDQKSQNKKVSLQDHLSGF